MKRKYLSALLMGALTMASVSTFTSCKDYDSDISNLQGQIDKAALSTDVQTLKSQVEAAASSASSAATSAEKALGETESLDKELTTLETIVKYNANAAADAIDSMAVRQTKLSDRVTAIEKANKAAADSAASAIAKANQLDEKLENALKKWGESKDTYYTATQIDNKLDSLADVIAKATDDSIASLKKVVNGYKDGINALYTAVTGVSLIVDESYITSWQGNSSYSPYLYFTTGKVQESRTFGAGEVDDTQAKNKYTATPTKEYKKGASVNFPAEILVRVNPVNAKLAPNMIKLVDSKGNDLNDILEVTSVTAYDQLIVRNESSFWPDETRASSKSGLWVVSLQVKDGVNADDVKQGTTTSSQGTGSVYNPETGTSEEKEGTWTNNSYTAYAVAVNNTADQAEAASDAADRYVVSEYGLTVRGTNSYSNINYLGNVKVAAESKSADEDSWYQIQMLKPNNYSSKTLAVSNGENILIDFSGIYKYGSNNRKYCPIDRFYVVLDKGHAGENEDSQTSEINAWNSYSYTGLNQVVAVDNGKGIGKVSVKINGQVGDEVQFRIFAVNYDGTLVENGGRAFRVYVGAEANKVSVTGTLKATTNNYMETDWIAIDGSLKDASNGNNSIVQKHDGHVTMTTTNGKVIDVHYDLSTNGKDKATDNTKLSDCKYIKFWVNNNEQATEWASDNRFTKDKLTAGKGLQLWADDTEATGSLHDDWTDKTYVNDITVKLTKQMPTGADAKGLVKYTWKDNQKVDGVYTAYLYPLGDDWEAIVSHGYKDMSKAISDMTGNCYVEVENAEMKYEADGTTWYWAAPLKSNNSYTLYVDNTADYAGTKLIDNTTKHKSYVKYNFGPISSANTDNYIVSMEEFSTIFACPLTKTAQTYSWTQIPATKTTAAKNVNVLTYGSTATVDNVNLMKYIIGKNTFDNTVFGGDLKTLIEKYQNITAKLISNGSGKEDYYTVKSITADGIEFEKKSSTTNPSADVASKLVLTMTDCFGHENVYELPFTVKRAE